MLHVSCQGCYTSAYVDCHCPVLGHDPMVARAHHPLCPLDDVGSNVVCGCCTEEHSHDAMANACPGIESGHSGADCKHPNPMECAHHPDIALDPKKACPGGHCGPGIDGCTVCRPVTITVMPGSTQISMTGSAEG